MGSPHVPSRLALVAATTAAIAVVGCLLVLSRTLGDAGGEGGGGRKAPRGDRWGFGTVPSSINHQNERPTAATATGGLGMLAGSCESKGERDCAALGNDWRSPSFYPPNNHEAASASPLIAVGHATRFLRQAFSLLGAHVLSHTTMI